MLLVVDFASIHARHWLTLSVPPCPGGWQWLMVPEKTSGHHERPIALAKVMSIAQLMKTEFPGQDRSLSGIGGVECGSNAAEFIPLGANTVQVCTSVMLHGYDHVKTLCSKLQEFRDKHGFTSIEDFWGGLFGIFHYACPSSTTTERGH